MNCIEISCLSKSYRKDFWRKNVAALSGVSFSVEKSGITGFVGPNGAGKTTTIKAIMGLIRPDSGSVKINGINSNNVLSRKNVSYLSEQPYFYGHLSARESLLFASNLLGLPRKNIVSGVDRVLGIVELSLKAQLKVREMSKGMQQRLNMAQALLGKPEIMILDEPMSGMDPPGRRLFRTIFKQLESEGVTIFFSTHVLEDIETVCDRIVVLSKGKLDYCGSVKELLDRGIAGTEISIDNATDDVLHNLRERGCTVDLQKGKKILILVPKELDYKEILRTLGDRNIYPSGVQTRTARLENLLYGQKTEGVS